MQLTTITATGTKGQMNASDLVFAAKVNQTLLAQAVRVYIANEHQGTSVAQTRSEVNRTKKKWFKQKGTGNARHGARTSNIFVGGGAAHGPKKERGLSLTLSKKLKKKALISALSLRAKEILVCDAIAKLEGKTKSAALLFGKINPQAKNTTVVLADMNESVLRSLRNLKNLQVVEARNMSVLDALDTEALLLTKKAVEVLEARLTPGKDVAVQRLEKKPAAKKTVAKVAKKAAAK